MERARAPRTKILYVEDDVVLRRSITSFLNSRGFDVQQAENGLLGIEQFHRETPDLVLCDLRMPGVDGLEVLAAVKAARPDVPVVIVSATDAVADAVSALKLGASDFIVKPVMDPEIIVLTIERCTSEAALKREVSRYREELEEMVRVRTTALEREVEDRRRAEKLLTESLAEKDVLLKEVHHRVKNNLQIISSLLSLQGGRITDPSTIRLMEESRNRIRSIALVHEFLYLSDNLSKIDFRGYITGLVDQLVFNTGTGVRVRTDLDGVEDVHLTIDTAIPCGLIVNELATNALVHAFGDDRRGTISVVAQVRDGTMRLSVTDDGRGLPDSFVFPTSGSLGMQLVASLVTQLHGTVAVEPAKPGTRFRIIFAIAADD